jgi:hypothetical protein
MLDMLEQVKSFWLWLISPSLSLLNCFLVMLCICLIYFYIIRDRHPRRNSFTISGSSVFLLGILILTGVQGAGQGEGRGSDRSPEDEPPTQAPKADSPPQIPTSPPGEQNSQVDVSSRKITVRFGQSPFTCTITGPENIDPIIIDQSESPNPRETFWAMVRQGIYQKRGVQEGLMSVEIRNAPGEGVQEFARNMIQMYFPESKVTTHHD